MKVVLWDTHKRHVVKDAMAGHGLCEPSLPDRLFHSPLRRRRWPAPLLLGYLAAVFKEQGFDVKHVSERMPSEADVFVFRPSFPTLPIEQQMIWRVADRYPDARVLVVGPVATATPEAFEGLGATVLRGDAELLRERLDEVLSQVGDVVGLGAIEDLGKLPQCDWSPFEPWRWRISDEFWQFPTAAVEHGRGCPHACKYCPESATRSEPRFRPAEQVADEIQFQINQWGFYSFKFHDPTFGWNADETYRLAGELGKILQDFQFSIETRVENMPPEMLRALRSAGLRCVSVGVESADATRLHSLGRPTAPKAEYRRFFEHCGHLGLRTIATFMLGLPNETDESIQETLDFAKQLQPTFAKFRFVTPYPQTVFAKEHRREIANFQYADYTTQTPIVDVRRMSPERLKRHIRRCRREYYARWGYFRKQLFLLWPRLAKWALHDVSATKTSPSSQQTTSEEGVRRPHMADHSAQQTRRDKAHQREGQTPPQDSSNGANDS